MPESIDQIASNLDAIEQVQSEQGWSRSTMFDLYKDFVNNKELTGEFLVFLRKIQKEENGEDESDYSKLTKEQIDTIRKVLIDVEAAGNEGPTDASTQAAWSLFADSTIGEIMDEINARDISLRTRIEFDPETGKPWEDEG